jgi:hypothetical protein
VWKLESDEQNMSASNVLDGWMDGRMREKVLGSDPIQSVSSIYLNPQHVKNNAD